MVTNEIHSKWRCGNLLITSDNKVYYRYNKSAKKQLKGGSYGYYVNRRFRTLKWIRKNCVKHVELVRMEIIVPF
jgi:hypothetical protein